MNSAIAGWALFELGRGMGMGMGRYMDGMDGYVYMDMYICMVICVCVWIYLIYMLEVRSWGWVGLGVQELGGVVWYMRWG